MAIKVLSEKLINQIAAGEVIERPSAVIKECLENSIDAGARNIIIYLDQGGLRNIKITDDGQGIPKSDLSLVITSHATSKIVDLDDLVNIHSLGFRGEALASIASISQLTCTSKARGAAQAYQNDLSPAAHPEGTTIEVRELFYNVPARRKFMKSVRTEYLQCEAVIKKLALSHPEISFRLYHNNKEIFYYLSSDKLTRTQKIFGKKFIDHSREINTEISDYHLQGWVAKPSFMRAQSDMQYFYLNNRMIRDKLITHAIKVAHEEILYPGRYPAYVLYLTCDPALVDVNVHPTKHEVRFQQAREVHDFIVSQLKTYPEPLPSKASVLQTSVVAESIKGIVGGRFILAECGGEIIFIDAQRAQQALDYGLLTQAPTAPRPLLMPIHCQVPENLAQALLKQQKLLNNYGIELNQLSQNQVIIRSIPAQLPQLDCQAWLDNLTPPLTQDQLIQSLLAHNTWVNLSEAQAASLLRQIQASDLPEKNHRGERIYRKLSQKDLEAMRDGA